MSKFSLTLSPKFKHPVRCEVSTEQGRANVKFEGIFLRTSEEEWEKLLKAGVADRELVKQKLVGWEEVDGDFTPENLERLLAIDGMTECVVAAFVTGNSVAPRKN